MAASLCCSFLRRSVLCRPSIFSFINFASKSKWTKIEGKIINPRQTGINLDGRILTAHPHSPGSVLDVIDEKMSINEAANAIAMLSKCKSANILTSEQIMKNEKFLDLCRILEDNFKRFNHGTLLFTLKNVLNIGVPADDRVVQTLENQVLWLLGKMAFKNLVTLLSFHVQFQESQLQKKVVVEAVKRIQLRWFEMERPRDIIQLSKCVSYFPEEFVNKLEDRAVEVAEKMTAEEASKLIVVTAEKGRRPTPLLRSVAFYISKHEEKLPLKQTINLLHSLATIKFADEVLLERLSTDLLPQIPAIKNPANLSTLLIALGQLRWRHIDLLEAAVDWMVKNMGICRAQEMVALVLTLAKLNFLPSNADGVFQLILPRLTQDVMPTDSTWLDVVWSLAVLQKCTANHASSVLKPEFYEKLTLGSPTLGHKLKILNINAYAQQELAGYKGPLLSKEPLLGNVVIVRSAEEKTLCESVFNTLSNFIPVGKFLVPGRLTSFGIYIDAEFTIGQDGKPLVIDGDKSDNSPNASKKIALIITHYKDLCRYSREVNGIVFLSTRLIKAAGYKILQVRHSDYDVHATTLKRVQYLQGLIAEIVAK